MKGKGHSVLTKKEAYPYSSPTAAHDYRLKGKRSCLLPHCTAHAGDHNQNTTARLPKQLSSPRFMQVISRSKHCHPSAWKINSRKESNKKKKKKINLELQLASKKPAVLQKSRKVRNGRTGRLEGFNGTAGQSQQQLGKRAQSAASILKVASWSLEGLYPHSGKQLLGVEWRQTEKCQSLFRQMKTEILAVIQVGRMQPIHLSIHYLYIFIHHFEEKNLQHNIKLPHCLAACFEPWEFAFGLKGSANFYKI